MLLVSQSISTPSLRGWENQAIFATRSPTAIRNIRPFRPRRKARSFRPQKKHGFRITETLRTWRYVMQETYEGPEDNKDD